jgi:hypothetical protein
VTAGLAPSDPAHLLLRFSEAVDQRAPAAVAGCFTRDALFRPGTREIVGAHDIGLFYHERLADPRRRTRHSWTNVVVDARGPDTARVTALLTNYAFEPKVAEDALQMRIGNVECRLERDMDGVWRFAEHLYENAFAVSLPLAAS